MKKGKGRFGGNPGPLEGDGLVGHIELLMQIIGTQSRVITALASAVMAVQGSQVVSEGSGDDSGEDEEGEGGGEHQEGG